MKTSKNSSKKFVVALCASESMREIVQESLGNSAEVLVKRVAAPSELLSFRREDSPDVMLCEVSEEETSIEKVLPELRKNYATIVILVLSGHTDASAALDFLRLGATDYVILPAERRKLVRSLEAVLEEWRETQQKQSFLRYQTEKYDFTRFIGTSPQLLETLRLTRKVIESNCLTVLILGETGIGKELLAKAIHYNSANHDQPFVEIACSAIPEPLLESELFGHEKGAFTDAREQKIGLFELAKKGSIFLDEIGDISLRIQSKLLKVVEDKVMRRVGGTREISVTARIIAATSRDLDEMVRTGAFRRDLYHRLRILPLKLAPLRERIGDIPPLAHAFLKQYADAYGKKLKGISDEAERLILGHRWEGNVRELKHSIERAVLLSEGEWITPRDFDFSVDMFKTSDSLPGGAHIMLDVGESGGETLELSVSFEEASIASVSKLLTKEILRYTRGNKSRSAKILGISRPKLDRLISQDPQFFRDAL